MEEKEKNLKLINDTAATLEKILKEYYEYKEIGEVSEFRKLKENVKYPDIEYGYLTPYEKDLGLKDTDWCIEKKRKLTPNKREENWGKQRQIYGFDDREIWNLDVTICNFLYNRLSFLREHYATQDSTLVAMIDGFGEYLKPKGDSEKTDKAFRLLADYYRSLWV